MISSTPSPDPGELVARQNELSKLANKQSKDPTIDKLNQTSQTAANSVLHDSASLQKESQGIKAAPYLLKKETETDSKIGAAAATVIAPSRKTEFAPQTPEAKILLDFSRLSQLVAEMETRQFSADTAEAFMESLNKLQNGLSSTKGLEQRDLLRLLGRLSGIDMNILEAAKKCRPALEIISTLLESTGNMRATLENTLKNTGYNSFTAKAAEQNIQNESFLEEIEKRKKVATPKEAIAKEATARDMQGTIKEFSNIKANIYAEFEKIEKATNLPFHLAVQRQADILLDAILLLEEAIDQASDSIKHDPGIQKKKFEVLQDFMLEDTTEMQMRQQLLEFGKTNIPLESERGEARPKNHIEIVRMLLKETLKATLLGNTDEVKLMMSNLKSQYNDYFNSILEEFSILDTTWNEK